MANKGGQYERDICRTLSLWMTNGRDDDQLWRSSQSGGRATSRAKKGKKTKGHSGDTVATGKHGRRLLKLVTMEIKRGYNRDANVHTLLDLRPATDAVQTYEDWLTQAHTAAYRAGTPFWWLIHRRDRRAAVLYMPFRLWDKLRGFVKDIEPLVAFQCRVRRGRVGKKMKTHYFNVVGMPLDTFLTQCPPDLFWRCVPEGAK